MKQMIAFLLAVLPTLMIGCTAKDVIRTDSTGNPPAYTQITQEEARRMINREDGHVVVDVRRQDEYDSGHIPGAILIPNEEIETAPPPALPDKTQTILIYCRSGRRSKEAAQKLAEMGYTNVYEFGGIITWEGEITPPKLEDEMENTAVLEFHSFDGGGPSFTAVLEDSSIVAVEKTVEYSKPNHAELDGAGFTVTFTFSGRKAGKTGLVIEERSPIAGNYDRTYAVTVSDDMHVMVEALGVLDLDVSAELVEPVPVLAIMIEDQVFFADFEDNASAEALIEQLSGEPLSLELHDYGGFEKVGDLPWELPGCDESITTVPGDIILYQGKQITIYYGENTWELTRLARIPDVTKEYLLRFLGAGNISVRIWVEWRA